MADKIGAAIIGAGFGGRVHLPGLQHLDGVRVAGIAASSLERARQVASPAGVDGYDDYRRLIDRADVQLVTISAPAPFHHEMVLAALERGKHVICEKPFAGSVQQAEEMLRLAETAGVVHAIDFEFRYTAARQQVKALVEQGYVGQPRVFNAVLMGRMRGDPNQEVLPWSVTREGMGGPLGAVGVHLMDAACWIMGEPASVSAQLDTVFTHRRVKGGQTVPATCDDNCAITLHFRGSGVANVDCTVVAGQLAQPLEVHGSQGSLVVPDHFTLLGGQEGGKLEPLAIEDRLRPAAGWAPGGEALLPPFTELASRVLARIRGEGAASFPTFHDGLRSQRLVDAVYRSSDEGRVISLGEKAG
ncbi:MAG: Gfo/Idh/MocA family protein [Chloroflexota bacterium]